MGIRIASRQAVAALILGGVIGVLPAAAQPVSATPAGAIAPLPASRWRIVAPDAALAWFTVLADLRVPGAGALPFTAPARARAGDPALEALLAATRESEILHFVPLYHPSADRAALVAAVRVAAGEGTPAPRATLLTGALRGALPSASRRAMLLPLADAVARAMPAAPSADRLAALQRTFHAEFGAALAPWLASEGLDAGRLIVAPTIGAEGRLFAATRDRTDNLVAVGLFADDPDPEAPLLAFARESCFPAVTRAARAAGFDVRDRGAAHRASIAAVRCGAALLDARLPSRSVAYRAFWLRRMGAPPSAAFDDVFPTDAALAGSLDRALRSPFP